MPAPPHLRVDAVRGLADQLARLLRRQRLRRRWRGHVQRRQLREQPLDARRVRRLVDAEQRGQLARLEQPRDGLVGGDHQELDQPVRLGLLGRQQALDVPLVREAELGLLRLHGQGAPRFARIRQRRRDLARRGQRRGPRLLRTLGAREDPVHARVVEPLVGADDRAVEGRAPDLRTRELELDRDRQPVLARHERARPVRQCLGQHRLDQPRHVDGVRAPERLAVQRRAGPHVRRHVGDVHPDAHRAVGQFLGRDRVVEVARGRRVDRERREVAEVTAAGAVGLGHTRLALHQRIEAAPQPALEHQRVEHVARDVRAPDPPLHPCSPAAGG